MSNSVKREKEKTQPVQVYVRVRPLNKQERENRSLSCIDVVNSRELFVKHHQGRKYNFDGVFGPMVKQLTVYETIVKQLIGEILAGYNCTVFAYGQTGTGKTHTMAGGSACTAGISWQDDEQSGIIPRALSHLFDELRLIQQDYTVRVSYLELYNEELYDLLADGDDTAKIRIYDDQRQKGSVIIQGIEKQTVHNKYEVFRILEKGQEKRRTATTLMNAQSSRSHAVFCITLHTRETTVEGEELVKTGKLNLVDLAGSENISRSGAVDRRAREAGNINQSLLNLGRVIKALVEDSPHIPYRASKLTRILQDSLGGRTKTSIIATVSPAACSMDETLSTLEYASRARNITNRPEVNQRMSQKELMSQYVEEIDRLRKDLSAARTGTGIVLASDNYDRLMYDQQMCAEELAEKVTLIRDLEQQIKNLEEQKQMVEDNWTQLQGSFDETSKELEHTRDALKQTITEKEEQEHLSNCYAKHAETLQEQAKVLLDVTQSSTFNEAVLREKVERLYTSAIANNANMKKMSTAMEGSYRKMVENLVEFSNDYYKSHEYLTDVVSYLQQAEEDRHSLALSVMTQLVEDVKGTLSEYGLKENNHKEATRREIDKLINRCSGHVEALSAMQSSDFSQLRQNLDQALLTNREQQKKLCDKMEAQLKKVSDTVTVAEQDVTTSLKDVKTDLLSENEKLKKSLNTQDTSMDDTVNQLVKWREDLLKLVDTGFEAFQQQIQHGKKTNKTNLAQVDGIARDLESRLPAVDQKIQSSIKKTANEVAQFKAIVDENKCENEVLQQKISKDFNSHIEAKEQRANSKAQDFAGILKSSSDEFVTANFETLAQISNAIENKLFNLLNVEASASAATSISHSNIKNKIKELLGELVSHYDAVLHHEASFTAKLHSCQDSLTNFVNKDVIEIRHGGDTPARSKYNYPAAIKQISPKDRILLKYRQQQMVLNEEPDSMESSISNSSTDST